MIASSPEEVRARLRQRYGPLLSPAAIRVFLGIAGAWKMSFAEQAERLALPRLTWSKCVRGAPVVLTSEVLKRIVRTARIFEAINTLLPPHRADAWMRAPNAIPGFVGRSAIELMIEEGRAGIAVIRQYLAAQLNG